MWATPERWWRRVWAGRDSVSRVDYYTRGTLYVIQASELLVLTLYLDGPRTWATSVGIALTLLHTGLCLTTLHTTITASVRETGIPRRLLGAATAFTVALGLLALLVPALLPPVAPGPSGRPEVDPAVPTIGALAVLLIAAASPVIRSSLVGLLGGLAGTLVGLVGIGRGLDSSDTVKLGTTTALMAITLGLGYQLSIWILRVIGDLAEAQQTRAALAVAEERLRFSRDLHDVLGSQLSAIAVKSELVAELARRGLPSVVDQAGEVRQLAHGALREVREVVSGYRRADLATELAGSASLLRAAGVECEPTSDGVPLDRAAQEALAWVVREAATNVLRHSEATRCDVVLRADARRAVLTVTNDGARAAESTDGNGLAGLRERLAARGGSLRVRSLPPDSFTLVAEVPLGGER
ncbi:sensor histidine kinase [Cryptosporangium aurantiacum]|uniref:Two-component system, NarL family, sensor histidine kinase DesK n=1 Tax=Cryptosporangium aurantiacum TaxID=134849 RepID=A0A1M7RPI8_9ACTN|nr:sensor histidine kinase [Cryptosporangium aurantiacum]SHN47988.1 two-component system, NarL family, sensor histidine kinase DesK [Cryptosporangium aurantiacum]